LKLPATVLAVLAWAAISAQAAEPPSFTVTLEEKPTPAEVVRCHFDEGRIVVRINDRLHVLHQGDGIEGTQLSVISIERSSATLTLREGGAAGSLRIVRITQDDAGKPLLRELSTDPNAVRNKESPSAKSMGHQRSEPPERSPSDS